MKTTLNKIREHSPCTGGWEKLLTYLGKTKADDEPLAIATIIDSNGLDDALWCLRAVEGHDKEIRLFAVWCARQVQHLMTDKRSLDALDVAEGYANGQATEEELNAARSAAWRAVDTARDVVVWDAAWAAAEVVWDVAWASVRDTADAAVKAAAGAAAWEAAMEDTAWSVAWDAAWDATRAKQEAELRRICEEG